ncbi:ATP-binding protein [Natronorubrum thiooxidans]|uniref:Histidine kinase-, DNA gyrase B-, and HSP90-like ATPase n=1 Tax=Natronorubrum thiooxidans TaxID=308853 RepID=A0A1N7GUN0_9EURY|nr:ATP-binding protein [Natronorubrum thiooxidans]SIS16246.1 Histidine kinase-, DNA gyrase B-, and HSP90-like ATPase [Natronorubrum thiooxidans]
MTQRHSSTISQQAQLLPTKDTLTALKSDVNLETACLELCDNALDAWKRTSNREDRMTIDISVNQNGKSTTLSIRDNAGGIPREDAAMLFGLGHTAKESISGSIGTYGVGAKKSLVNLGVPFRISSRATNADTGWTYRITEDWFEDDHDWTVPINQTTDIEPGVTELLIEDLNYEWDDSTSVLLRETLGEAYNLFLCDELQQVHETTYDLTIRVNGVPVEPEGVPDWSFSPFDGVHPRRFENITVTTPDMEEPVVLHITVGLLRKKDSQNAGTDIYCQKRKVASCLRNEKGGYGAGKDRLENFSARHERLKVILELETVGDGQMLPWDTQKSSIDPHNPIMRGTADSRGVYNWVRRTVQDYYQLDADKIPTAFVEPFDTDHEFAINNGQPVRLDYADRERVVSHHRPNTDLPQVSEIRRKAASHAKLRISGVESLEPWEEPAYESQLIQESNRNIDNLASVTDSPTDDVLDNPHQAAGRISELARVHLEHGVYYPDNLEEWQRPRYREYMEKHEGDIPSQQDSITKDIPLRPAEMDNDSELIEVGQSDGNGIGHVHTGQTVKEENITHESAELFLVFGGDSDDERGAKVLDVSRPELCQLLELETDAVDEIIWEELELQFDSIASGKLSE